MFMNKNILVGLAVGQFCIGHGGVLGRHLSVYLLLVFRKGRTIREFIFGVLVIPSMFGILWFTVFGNTAIWLNDGEAAGALGQMISSPETLLFKFLDLFTAFWSADGFSEFGGDFFIFLSLLRIRAFMY